MPHRLVALALVLAAAPVEAARYLCLGQSPRFAMTLEGAEVLFDYFGDGTYRLSPPAPATLPASGSRHTLFTAREEMFLFLEPRPCRVLSATLPVRVEVAVRTSDGLRPFVGCCTVQTP